MIFVSVFRCIESQAQGGNITYICQTGDTSAFYFSKQIDVILLLSPESNSSPIFFVAAATLCQRACVWLKANLFYY